MHQNLCSQRRLNLLNSMAFLVESPQVSFLLLAWHLTLTSLNSVIKRPLHAVQVLHVFLTFPIPTSIILGLSITLASLSPLSTIPMIQLWLPCIEIKNENSLTFFVHICIPSAIKQHEESRGWREVLLRTTRHTPS